MNFFLFIPISFIPHFELNSLKSIHPYFSDSKDAINIINQ